MIIAVNRFTDTVTKIKPNAKGNHMMKKIIAIALAAVTVLSFAACTKQDNPAFLCRKRAGQKRLGNS